MATIQKSAVVGVFEDRAQAERAAQELRKVGFLDDQIGFITRDVEGSWVAREQAGEAGSKVAEGVGTGVFAGGVLGALAGAAAVVTGVIPGVGPVVAGGLLACILGGAAATGAVAGGVVGALVGLGIPEEEARHFEREFHAGRVLLVVERAEGHDREAAAILRRCGGYTSPRLANVLRPQG
jgi:hypothetical protein